MFSFLSRSTQLPHPLDKNFWLNKRVLITGHTGFIGGWLYFWLREMEVELAGFSLAPSSDPSFYDLSGIKNYGKHHIADLRDAGAVKKAISEFNPHIILHLGAQALVRPAFKDPVDTFSTNVNGTIHVLEAARECKDLQAVLIFTTDKVYENIEVQRGYGENDKLGGYEPYGASKACAEIVTSSYWHSYFKSRNIPFATLRAGNVIGGGDWSVDRLIPDAVRAFGTGQPLILRHPQSVRPWQHVLEPCYAIMRIVEETAKHRSPLLSFNIGPDARDCQTVGWIADHFVTEWNTRSKSKAEWKHVPDNSIYEAKLLMLDNRLARKTLGWNPRWTTKQAIQKTAHWYAVQHQGKNVENVTRSQIMEFINGDHHG
ncbi:MAG: CDP-glucose 4,6-dehydratase [Alphaproteobacteria bacterium]|nr:MAG: CDP-glucose 4,6-dehydratase [Alphaproteobacteria bacterium]